MNWNKDYENLMRGLGVEPYGCPIEGCSHVSGGMFRLILHHRFGIHYQRESEEGV